jgi:hypothetical protein
MAKKKKNTVFVELYNLKISRKANERFGRIVPTRSVREDDLISAAAARYADLDAKTLRTSLDVLKEIAIEEIAAGASVQFGTGFFCLASKGLYYGDQAQWDPEVNSLFVKAASGLELREAIGDVHVKVRGMAAPGTIITSLTDKSSGEENTRLTPGGIVTLVGNKICIMGGRPENGIRLIEQNSGVIIPIPTDTILINESKKVVFPVPGYLPAGDYKLSLTTEYSTTYTTLKGPAVCVFDYVLAVDFY